MRRLLLVNALIFAVLAAAVTLAYYGYSYATEVSYREAELASLRELAADKVFSVESSILRDDDKMFRALDRHLSGTAAPLQIEELVNNLGIHLVSVFVLDDKQTLVPGGYVSQRRDKEGNKEGTEFRDWFMKEVLPQLRLHQLPLRERAHLHGTWEGKDYLWSMIKRSWGDKVHYIVIEEDLAHLVGVIFPQFFPFDNGHAKRLFEVVDQRGELVYTPVTFSFGSDASSVDVSFVDSVDGWSVRVTEVPDKEAQKQVERKRLIDSLFIGGAITVILTGLVFLALAIRRERRANELKSEFISNVSHELKTPLSIISMFGEMLANGRTKGPEQATEYADIIWRESVRLGRLIDNVLDFAKIERGKGVYEFSEADVGEVVERAVDLVGRRLTTAEMAITVDIEPELPLVKLDGNAFTLAVMNLIDNAIKYAAGGKKIELTLAKKTIDEKERLVLSVRDFGPGIEPAEQDQIFERFYRARAVRLKPIRGSGIGLALVQHIARAHHGDVTVTSEVGKGSTFELWLPIPDQK